MTAPDDPRKALETLILERDYWKRCATDRQADCESLHRYVLDAQLEADKRGRIAGETLAEWIARLPIDGEHDDG